MAYASRRHQAHQSETTPPSFARSTGIFPSILQYADHVLMSLVNIILTLSQIRYSSFCDNV